METRTAHIKRLLEIHRGNLHKLQAQIAAFGLHAPPHLLLQAEDEENAIRELETELKKRQKP